MGEEKTVIVDGRERSSGAGWVIAIVLIVALIVGAVIFSRMSGSEAAKDNAVASAANNVGEAARDVGSAAKDAADGAR